jgi:hypothetical protein
MMPSVAEHTNSASTVAGGETSARSTTLESVLYILSPSYSGSTLLTLLLAQHPEIATIGELKAATVGSIPDYRCSCGALLRHCLFWKEVGDAICRRGCEFSLENLGTHIRNEGRVFRQLVNAGVRGGALPLLGQSAIRFMPAYRKKLARIVQQNVRLMEVITAIQRARIFLDGSKDPERLDIFRRYIHRPLKIIRLIRDGRGVASSYMKHYGVDMRTAAKELARTNRACDTVLSRIAPSDKVTIHYEDLCRDPEKQLLRIYRLAGLDPRAVTQPCLVSDCHILGNAMRLEAGKSIVIDEQWRNGFRPADARQFERIAGEQNRKYGYR